MDTQLYKLLKKTKFPEILYPNLEECSYKGILNKTNGYIVVLNSKEILDLEIYLQLNKSFSDSAKVKCITKIELDHPSYKNIETYYDYVIDRLEYNQLKGRLKKNFFEYVIEVYSDLEMANLKRYIEKVINELQYYGFPKLEISFNEDYREKIKEEIKKETNIKVKEEEYVAVVESPKNPWEKFKRKKIETSDEPEVIVGEKILEDPITLDKVNGPMENLIINAEIFGCEGKTGVSKKSGKEYFMITIKLTDSTNSIYGKVFARSNDQYEMFMKLFQNGATFLFKGETKINEFDKKLEFNINSINLGLKKEEKNKREDTSLIKRVEFHTHTKLSQMDGVADEVKIVKQAMKWGMNGIAITDHDCCQSFPHVFNTVVDYNKGKKKEQKEKISKLEEELNEYKNNPLKKLEIIRDTEGSSKKIEELIDKCNSGLSEEARSFVLGRKNDAYDEKIEELENKLKEEKNKKIDLFKVGYGCELQMCESTLNVCFNPNDKSIKNQTFVVFDTETTGFNAGLNDSMIEIGGVKIENGNVIDRYDSLINPGHHIDEAITKVTDISDEDVKDSPNEEKVIKEFKEWIGDLPLVAHNAKFDKSMLDSAYSKYNLGKLENPIIDTLMLSRVINRDLKKHSLKALGKNYGIDTGEEDEDEDENSVSNTDIQLDNFTSNQVKDVLIDEVSILKIENNIKYLKQANKASKTEKCTIRVVLEDSEDYIKEVELHAAGNNIELNIDGYLKLNINVYVGQHHGADVDSENTALIFNKMLKQIEGIDKISDLNNLSLLERLSFENDQKKLDKIGELCSYKNYVRQLEEDEEPNPKFKYPFIKYNNKNYVWRFEWCSDDHLQMYENIPSKTFNEHIANMYDFKHVILIAKNQKGLKNLFKLISYANSNFLQTNATIPRKLIDEYREGLLIGSACLNGEIFNIALTQTEEVLKEAIKWYDYIEVQPIENYSHLLRNHDINSEEDIKKCINKIIKCSKEVGKLIIATGDVHQIDKEDRLYREIIVNQNVPGKGRHPLARYLNPESKACANLKTIEKLAKENSLNYIDKKVLTYIYALTNLSEIPINYSNIVNIYNPEKKVKEEEVFKDKNVEKATIIEDSLNNLLDHEIIKRSISNNTYSLNKNVSTFIKTEVPKNGHIPNQYFRTTNEMMDEFKFIDKVTRQEIVIDNTNKLLDQIEDIEVVVYPDKPFSPIIEHSQEICRDLVFDKAHSMYGDPLPRNIEDRIAQEFYGDKIDDLVKNHIKEEHKDYTDEQVEEIFSQELHKVIMSGYDGVVELKKEEVKKSNPELNDEELTKEAKAQLTGIIGGGFDVIYLIAQKLVKHSNDDGYLVGSRGSVGSSFVASMMGITECNGLPPHYYCPKCCHSEFINEEGIEYAKIKSSGFDLPEKNCPKCNTIMIHQGNDMPFATFLGFAGEKVPDIDLNFSGDNQASAHEYTKVLFGTDNVYRAGTIGTVADKTAYGFAMGFYEEELYNKLKAECNSYGINPASKDELKKKSVIKCTKPDLEVERISLGCIDVKRTTGQHPGGIVVVPGYKDVWDFTPFQYPADDPTVPWRTTHFDYHAIDADLLKLDILGHDDPTVLRMLQDLTGIDITEIDLGDLDTMKIFTGPEVLGVKKEQLRGLIKRDEEGNVIEKYCPTGTLGVPEFGTSFLLGMLEDTKPTTFAELIKISGLSHGTDVWLGNAQTLCAGEGLSEEQMYKDLGIDKTGNDFIHVDFKDVIGCRDDIMVNLMQWGMKPSKAFKIMEFVRKGKPTKDPIGWKEHVKTMQEAGIPDWYIWSCSKIKYMFPKAHATAYVTSAFRIAWFKVHMPIYYYAAYFSIRCDQFDVPTMLLGERGIRAKIEELEEKKDHHESSNKEDNICDVLYLCLEMCCRGFHFKNIDIEESDANKFKVCDDGKGLLIPFSALDGLGANVANKIIKERNKSPYFSIEDLQSRGGVSKTLIEKMKDMGVLDKIPESNQLSLF